MIKKLLFTLILAFGLQMNAQNSKCSIAHNGTFELDGGEFGITKIVRNGKTQTETNELMGFKATYNVNWIDDCHYELTDKKVLKGPTREDAMPTDVMKAEILKIDGKKISLRLSSNYSTFVTDCEIVKIK